MTELPRAIIFDLDGTLVHSAPDLQASLNVALAAMGRSTLDLPTVTSFIGNGVERLVERALHATGGQDVALQARALAEFRAHYDAHAAEAPAPFDGAMETLRQLAALGLPMAVCTNKPQAPAETLCRAMGLTGLVDHVQGAVEDLPRKPDPAMLRACLRRLRADAQDALFVGDSKVDHDTAAAANVPFLLFEGGYLNHPLPDLPAGRRFAHWADFPIGKM